MSQVVEEHTRATHDGRQIVSNHVDWRLFLIAGVSNSAGATVGNPMDVIKIRLQLDNELSSGKSSPKKYNGMIRGLKTLVLEEGFTAIWKGWSAAMLREMTYSSIRMGAYEPIKGMLGGTDRAHSPLHIKAMAACTSGTIAAALTTPTDVVKVRLQAQRSGSEARHSGCLAAFRDIYRSGGVRALYTAAAPNIMRSMFATAGQVSSYDHTKHSLLNAGLLDEGVPLHIVSSTVAGFMNAAFASPFDIVKTRIINQPMGEGRIYNSMFDAWMQAVKSEGVACLYKGFFPAWMRIAPHTVVTFAVFEQLRILADMPPV